jgi:hypothetical protein
MAERILGEYGVNSQNTAFVPTTLGEISAAMRMGLGDATSFLGPPGDKIVQELALNPQLRILSLPQADALASNLGFVRHVTVPEGGFQLVYWLHRRPGFSLFLYEVSRSQSHLAGDSIEVVCAQVGTTIQPRCSHGEDHRRGRP